MKRLPDDFIGKKELVELEELSNMQKKIDADEIGIPVYLVTLPSGHADYTMIRGTQLKDDIRRILTTLKYYYGGKALKIGSDIGGLAEYKIFIPLNLTGKDDSYSGILVVVGLNSDINLKKRGYTKYFSIKISGITISKSVAKLKYNTIFKI